MRVNIAIPEADVTQPVLDAGLEAVTRLNEQLIDKGHPTFAQALPHGIRWKPEPPGAEHFDHAGIVAQRGWGDCDDLAPWHAASLRKTGEDPGAKAIVQRSGPNRWHAVVQRSDGRIDDPSKAAGMGQPGPMNGVHGAVVPLMSLPAQVSGAYVVRPSIAVRPAPQGWQARVDLPWHWQQHENEEPTPTDYAMAALHTAPAAPTALVGALDGAVLLGESGGFAHPEHLARLRCLADACEGASYPELVHLYGVDHANAAAQVVGSFFGNIAKAITSPVKAAAKFVAHPSLSNLTHIVTDPAQAALHAAAPITQFASHLAHPFMPLLNQFSPALSMIPGVGPLAHMGLDVLQHGLPQSFGDLAQFGLRNATSFIPGADMLKAALPFGGALPIPGMPGGGGMPFMPQGWPQVFH